MYTSSFNIRNVLFLILFLILFTGCWPVVKHSTDLKLKDGSDIRLYQREQDTAWIKVSGHMKEWDNHIIDNTNRLKDSNYVRLNIITRNIDTIFLSKFKIRIWYVENDLSKEITEGKIYYNPKSYGLDDTAPFLDMKDTLKDYALGTGSMSFIPILRIKSKPSIEIEKADYFISDIFFDCQVNGNPIVVHRLDTLYRKKRKLSGITAH